MKIPRPWRPYKVFGFTIVLPSARDAARYIRSGVARFEDARRRILTDDELPDPEDKESQ